MNDFERQVLEALSEQRVETGHVRSLMTGFERRLDERLEHFDNKIQCLDDRLTKRIKEVDDYVRTAAESVADLANLTTEAITEAKLTNEKMCSFEKNMSKDVNRLILENENIKMKAEVTANDVNEIRLAQAKSQDLPNKLTELKKDHDETKKKLSEIEKTNIKQDANLDNVNKGFKYFLDKLLVPLAVFIFAVAVYMKDKT